ncbi:MAG: WHG domain-containing protein [Acidocella sp.]|nr:WHG domain-containing protein [Acidocella sp.]
MNHSDTAIDLRARLVTAALAMLETDGAEPSLRAVARAVGVSAMAPYRHFPDKAALLAAVAADGFRGLAAALVSADAQPDPRAALVAQGMAFVAFARANPGLYRLMFSENYGNTDFDTVNATYLILAERVRGLVTDEVDAAILACRALVQGLASIALSGRIPPMAADPVARAIGLFVDGLGNAGSENPTERIRR